VLKHKKFEGVEISSLRTRHEETIWIFIAAFIAALRLIAVSSMSDHDSLSN
jgi:hypothetical protein